MRDTAWKPTKRWWSAYGALMGDGEIKPTSTSTAPKKPRKRDEEIEQEKFNAWFANYLEQKDCRWFHPANGGRKTLAEGARFKRLGVKPGVPDIVCPMARKSYHGLVIELKKIDGTMSDLSAEQRDWLAWFKRQGWSTHVGFGFEHAKKIILEYFA